MITEIYWNNRGDFKKEPRFCATGVNYGADMIVDSQGVVQKNRHDAIYRYVLGKEKPNYPVPAMRIRPSIVHWPADQTNFMTLVSPMRGGHWIAVGIGKYYGGTNAHSVRY